MNQNTLAAAGIYDQFDTVIQYFGPFDKSTVNSERYQSVIVHEIAHVFQSFFTLQGQSHFQIVGLINAALADLLEEFNGTLNLPFLPWLKSPEVETYSDRAIKCIDAIDKLCFQLGSSGLSSTRVNNQRHWLAQINVDQVLKERQISLKSSNRTLYFGDTAVIPIDYASICESMAKAIEMHHAASYFARLSTNISTDVNQLPENLTITPEFSAAFDWKLNQLAEECLADARLINYTYPFLLMLQSGFNIYEAVIFTIQISYMALMWNWSPPGILANEASGLVKFGTVAANMYCNLLNAFCEDYFVPVINSSVQDIRDGNPISVYFDRICEALDMDSFTSRLEFQIDMSTEYAKQYGEDDANYALPGRKWHSHLLNCSGSFSKCLLNEPLNIGLGNLLSPSAFLVEHNCCPAIITSDGLINSNRNSEHLAEEQFAFWSSLRFNKMILFEETLDFTWAKTLKPDIRDHFDRYLEQRFGIHSVQYD